MKEVGLLGCLPDHGTVAVLTQGGACADLAITGGTLSNMSLTRSPPEQAWTHSMLLCLDQDELIQPSRAASPQCGHAPC